MKGLMRAYGLYPLINRQGMSVQDFESLLTEAGEELEQLSLKPYVAL